jgi:hypothetical protein
MLVNIYDKQEIEQKIQELLTNPALIKKSVNLNLSLLERYTSVKIKKIIGSFYNN